MESSGPADADEARPCDHPYRRRKGRVSVDVYHQPNRRVRQVLHQGIGVLGNLVRFVLDAEDQCLHLRRHARPRRR